MRARRDDLREGVVVKEGDLDVRRLLVGAAKGVLLPVELLARAAALVELRVVVVGRVVRRGLDRALCGPARLVRFAPKSELEGIAPGREDVVGVQRAVHEATDHVAVVGGHHVGRDHDVVAASRRVAQIPALLVRRGGVAHRARKRLQQRAPRRGRRGGARADGADGPLGGVRELVRGRPVGLAAPGFLATGAGFGSDAVPPERARLGLPFEEAGKLLVREARHAFRAVGRAQLCEQRVHRTHVISRVVAQVPVFAVLDRDHHVGLRGYRVVDVGADAAAIGATSHSREARLFVSPTDP